MDCSMSNFNDTDVPGPQPSYQPGKPLYTVNNISTLNTEPVCKLMGYTNGQRLTQLQGPISDIEQLDEVRVVWTHDATLALINKRQQLADMFGNSAILQKQAWRKVAEELQALGHNYTDNDCSKKFRSLRARHKFIREKIKSSGNTRHNWRYYDAMEDVYNRSLNTSRTDVPIMDMEGLEEGRLVWTHDAILTLITRRLELAAMFGNSAISQRQAWRKLARELQALGYMYTEVDCSKKFRSLRARFKSIKEKNKASGSTRHTWRYYDAMEKIFSILPPPCESTKPDPQPSTSSVPPSHGLLDSEPPSWFVHYTERQKAMHEEHMALERRKVTALESLVQYMKQKY